MRASLIVAALGASLMSQTAAGEEQYLFDVMKSSTFRHAWTEMISGAKGLPPWIAQITGKGNYVASPGTQTTIDGRTYRLFHACKAHNCADSKIEVAFSADGGRAFGMLVDDGKPPRWFGMPDAAMQAALTKAMSE